MGGIVSGVVRGAGGAGGGVVAVVTVGVSGSSSVVAGGISVCWWSAGVRGVPSSSGVASSSSCGCDAPGEVVVIGRSVISLMWWVREALVGKSGPM